MKVGHLSDIHESMVVISYDHSSQWFHYSAAIAMLPRVALQLWALRWKACLLFLSTAVTPMDNSPLCFQLIHILLELWQTFRGLSSVLILGVLFTSKRSLCFVFLQLCV